MSIRTKYLLSAYEKTWYNIIKFMKNKSIEEILNFTIKECIDNYRDTDQGNCIARYELLEMASTFTLWVIQLTISSC